MRNLLVSAVDGDPCPKNSQPLPGPILFFVCAASNSCFKHLLQTNEYIFAFFAAKKSVLFLDECFMSNEY